MIQQSQSWAYIQRKQSADSNRYTHPNVHSGTVYKNQELYYIHGWKSKGYYNIYPQGTSRYCFKQFMYMNCT